MDHVDHTEKQGKEEQAAAPFSKMESHKAQIDPITYAEYGKAVNEMMLNVEC